MSDQIRDLIDASNERAYEALEIDTLVVMLDTMLSGHEANLDRAGVIVALLKCITAQHYRAY